MVKAASGAVRVWVESGPAFKSRKISFDRSRSEAKSHGREGKNEENSEGIERWQKRGISEARYE